MASETLMTPRAQISFAQQLFTPKSFNGGKAKYGCTLLFDSKAMASPLWGILEDAQREAAKEKFGSKVSSMKLKTPFLNGDDYPNYAGYAGKTFLRVSSEYKPQFVYKDGSEIPFDEAEEAIYSGAYARATLNVYAYDTQGNKGVAFGLRNIQKLGDGDSLGGRSSATSEFGAVEDDGEDLDDAFDKSKARERDLVG